eukprot:jgi/Ulvmu1/7574/UM037_0118.1
MQTKTSINPHAHQCDCSAGQGAAGMRLYEQEEQFWHRFGAKLMFLKGAYNACHDLPRACHQEHMQASPSQHSCSRVQGQEWKRGAIADVHTAIASALARPIQSKPHPNHSHDVLVVHQMAVELMTAQHMACEVVEQMAQTKGDLAEAKMRQQVRLCAGLDTQLQAAHAAIDAGASAAREWSTRAERLLQTFASVLNGSCCPPGVDELEQLGRMHRQLIEGAQVLPKPPQYSSLASLFSGKSDQQACEAQSFQHMELLPTEARQECDRLRCHIKELEQEHAALQAGMTALQQDRDHLKQKLHTKEAELELIASASAVPPAVRKTTLSCVSTPDSGQIVDDKIVNDARQPTGSIPLWQQENLSSSHFHKKAAEKQSIQAVANLKAALCDRTNTIPGSLDSTASCAENLKQSYKAAIARLQNQHAREIMELEVQLVKQVQAQAQITTNREEERRRHDVKQACGAQLQSHQLDSMQAVLGALDIQDHQVLPTAGVDFQINDPNTSATTHICSQAAGHDTAQTGTGAAAQRHTSGPSAACIALRQSLGLANTCQGRHVLPGKDMRCPGVAFPAALTVDHAAKHQGAAHAKAQDKECGAEDGCPQRSAQALWLRQQDLLRQAAGGHESDHACQGHQSPSKHSCSRSRSRSPAHKRGNYGSTCQNSHPPWRSPGKGTVQLGKSSHPRGTSPSLMMT